MKNNETIDLFEVRYTTTMLDKLFKELRKRKAGHGYWITYRTERSYQLYQRHISDFGLTNTKGPVLLGTVDTDKLLNAIESACKTRKLVVFHNQFPDIFKQMLTDKGYYVVGGRFRAISYLVSDYLELRKKFLDLTKELKVPTELNLLLGGETHNKICNSLTELCKENGCKLVLTDSYDVRVSRLEDEPTIFKSLESKSEITTADIYQLFKIGKRSCDLNRLIYFNGNSDSTDIQNYLYTEGLTNKNIYEIYTLLDDVTLLLSVVKNLTKIKEQRTVILKEFRKVIEKEYHSIKSTYEIKEFDNESDFIDFAKGLYVMVWGSADNASMNTLLSDYDLATKSGNPFYVIIADEIFDFGVVTIFSTLEEAKKEKERLLNL